MVVRTGTVTYTTVVALLVVDLPNSEEEEERIGVAAKPLGRSDRG